MKGKKILLSPERKGSLIEGIAGGTISPGDLVTIEATTEPDGTGRYTWIRASLAADGERRLVVVALENRAAGKVYTDNYADGDRFFGYAVQPGDEVNVNVQASAGALTIGGRMIGDASTGKLIKTTGTPESEPFECLETASDPAADAPYHMIATGQ